MTTNILAGEHVKFDTVEFQKGSNITLDTTTYPALGRFTI